MRNFITCVAVGATIGIISSSLGMATPVTIMLAGTIGVLTAVLVVRSEEDDD